MVARRIKMTMNPAELNKIAQDLRKDFANEIKLLQEGDQKLGKLKELISNLNHMSSDQEARLKEADTLIMQMHALIHEELGYNVDAIEHFIANGNKDMNQKLNDILYGNTKTSNEFIKLDILTKKVEERAKSYEEMSQLLKKEIDSLTSFRERLKTAAERIAAESNAVTHQ
jgi:hypothetical protein